MKSKFYMIVQMFLIVQITSISNLRGQTIQNFIDRNAVKRPQVSQSAIDKYYNSPEFARIRQREQEQEEFRRKKQQNYLENTYSKNVEKIGILNNNYKSSLINNCILFIISIALFILILKKSKNLI